MIPQVRRNTTATLEHYAPDGVPTTATVAVWSPGGSALVAAGTAASVDTVSTTATVTAGSTSCTVASAVGITPGRSYWLQTSAARGQSVTVVDISGTTPTLTLRQRLTFSATGAAFKGHRISYAWAVPSTTYRDCRVEWSYTVGGSAVVRGAMVDAVRWPFSLDLDKSRIEEACPLYGDTGDSLQDYMSLRDRAELDVFTWLLGRGICPDLVRTRTILETAAIYRILQLRLETEPDRTEPGPWGTEYRAALSAFESSRAWYDSDDDLEKTYATTSAGGARDVAGGEDRVPVRYMPLG